MAFLIDTSVISETLKSRPEAKVIDWLGSRLTHGIRSRLPTLTNPPGARLFARGAPEEARHGAVDIPELATRMELYSIRVHARELVNHDG